MTCVRVVASFLIAVSICSPSHGDETEPCGESLGVIIIPVMGSRRIASTARPLFKQLAAQVGRSAEIRSGRDWPDVAETLISGHANLALLSHLGFSRALETPGIHGIARAGGFSLVIFTRSEGGLDSVEAARHSSIAVPNGSDADIKAVAYFSDHSGSNRASPRWLRVQSGDEVMMSVLAGTAEAGVLPEFVLDWLTPELRDELRILGEIGSSAGTFLVAGPCVTEKERNVMRTFLLQPDPDPSVAYFLEVWRFGRFDSIESEDLPAVPKAGRGREHPEAPAASDGPSP